MAAGDPTGADLCSGTTVGNTLPTWVTFEEREITLGAGTALLSGKKYAIVLRAPSAYSTSTLYWKWETVGSGGGSRRSQNGGSSWAQFATRDQWFKTKASAVEKDSNTFSGLSYNFCGQTWQDAHIFTAGSDYTITSVVLNLCKVGSVEVGEVTVAITQVEGETYVEAPTKANTPAPGDAAVDVTLDQATLTWVDGGGADTFDVYYGTVSGSLTKVSSAQAGASFTVTGVTDGSPYSHLITRYWRIDSTNAGGTTTGDEWSFTTIRSRPPTVTYFDTSTGDYYQLLVQADGSYGDVPGVGVEWVDYQWVTYLPNFMSTARKLVAAAKNKIFIEDV